MNYYLVRYLCSGDTSFEGRPLRVSFLMQRWRRDTCLLRINNANGLTLDIALEQKSVTLLFLGVMLAERGKRLAVALGHKLSLLICTRSMWREVHATMRVERVWRQARCVSG